MRRYSFTLTVEEKNIFDVTHFSNMGLFMMLYFYMQLCREMCTGHILGRKCFLFAFSPNIIKIERKETIPEGM